MARPNQTAGPDYDPSNPLPNPRHEEVVQLIAASGGSLPQQEAYRRVYLTDSPQAAANLFKKRGCKERLAYLLRQRAGEASLTDEPTFEGFEALLNAVMSDVAELAVLCTHAGMEREAASAKETLNTLAMRSLSKSEVLRKADRAGEPVKAPILAFLDNLLERKVS
jgi:hypothetical protein